MSDAGPATPMRAVEASPDPRLALRAAIRARLRAVCGDWEAADFDALVQQIARTQQRWADAAYRE